MPFNPSIGGIEKVTDTIAKELQKKGHNIYYLCGKACNFVDSLLIYKFPAEQFYLPYDNFFCNKLNENFYIELIQKNNINIVINQRGTENTFNYARNVPKGVRFVSVIHTAPLSYMYGALYNKPTPKGLIHSLIQKITYPLYHLRLKHKHTKWACSHYKELEEGSDAIVLLSRGYIQDLISIGLKVNKNKYYFIPNINSFPEQQINFDSKENNILFVGRFASEKAPIKMIRIWERIYKRHTDWKLIMIGDGVLRKQVEQLITKEQIDRVEIIGQQSEVLPYYRKSKIVCLTSIYEGWGMTLTEGMQCGCIPFTFNSYAAATDIIDNETNGYLISPFNEEEYAEKLHTLMKNKDLQQRMSIEAIQKSRLFDQKVISDKWEKLLLSIYK